MAAIRATAAAVLILFTAVAAIGDCVTTTRLLSTRQSSPNLVSGPVAWSGSVLGVAKTQEGVASAVWFAVYDEDLQTLIGDRLIANDSRAIVALEWTGTEFGLFYRTQNQRLHLQRLTMMGDPIGGPIAITPSRTVYSGDEIDIEWSPVLDAYVVARDISQGQHKGIWITVVEGEGTHRTDRKLSVFSAAQSDLSVSVTASGVVGIFFKDFNGTIAFARMIETGVPIVHSVAQQAGNYIETAAHGNRFVVVHSVANGPKTEIRWIVADTSHQIVRPEGLLVEGTGDDVWPLALISNGEELALAYLNDEDRTKPLIRSYRLRRFTIDGTTLTDTNFAAAGAGAVTRAEADHDFVWTGMSYLQAAARTSADLLNSHLLRYCPLRAAIAADVAYGRPGQPVVFTAVPDGGVPGYTYAWTFGDPQRVFRTQSVARTYANTGTYTARLTVTDTTGATVTTTYTVNVVNVKRRSTRF